MESILCLDTNNCFVTEFYPRSFLYEQVDRRLSESVSLMETIQEEEEEELATQQGQETI